MHVRKLVAAAAMATLPGLASAAWEFAPELSLEAGQDDNIRLQVDNEEDATVATAELRGRARNVTERSLVELRGALRYTNYSGDTTLDDVDSQRVSLRAERRGLRWIVGADADARRDQLLRFSQIDGGIDGTEDDLAIDPIDPEQGAIEQDIDRTRYRARPYLTYKLNERSSMTVRGIYRRTQYDNTGTIAVVDSEETGGGVEYNHRLSERDTFFAKAERTTFEPDDRAETEFTRATVGWRRRASERLSWGIEAGARRAEIDGGSTETGLLVRGNVRWRAEKGDLRLFAERSNTPGAFGDVFQYDRLRAEWEHALTELWLLRTRAEYSQTETESGGSSARDRDYGEFSISALRALSPTWKVGLQYRYRQIERETISGTARSNGIFLRLEYNPLSRF